MREVIPLMPWAYTDFVWPFSGSVLAAAALLAYAWPRRDVQAARPFIAMTMLAGLWSLLSCLQVLAVGLDAKALLSGVRYLPIAALPVAWLAFALAYTGRQRWLAPRRLAALLALPLATLVVVATNGLHHLMFTATALGTDGPVPGVVHTYGAWFWLHTAYSYALLAAGAALIGMYGRTQPSVFRGQALLMLAGAVVPFFLNVLFLSAPDRFGHLDLTPVAFTASGVFFAWGLFRFHLLDLMPVARHAVVESLPDAVVVLDGRHRVVDLNPAARWIAGPRAAPAVGLPVASLLPGLDIPRPEETTTAVVSEQISLTVEGERRYFDCRVSPLLHRRGWTTSRLVVLVLRDVTEQKRAALLEAGQRRVLEWIAGGTPLPDVLDALARFAEEASPGGMRCSILLLDEDGRHLRHGAAPSLPAVYTQAVDGVEIGPSAGACGTAAYLGETVITTDIATDERWRDYRALALPLGLRACWSRPIWSSDDQILGTFAMYYGQPGEPAAFDARIIEITTSLAGIAIERRRIEAALVQAKEQAETMARLKSAFLASMSHEIRTPLTSIIGFADILSAELGTDHQDLVEHISKGGRRLLDTLNSVLDYARLEAGKVEVRAEVLDVSDVAQETVTSFQPQTLAKGLSLVLEDHAHGARARLDRALLMRVLNNLIENAIKFTDEGRVVLRVRADETHVVLAVEDTGRGISEAFLPFVFDEFKQESTGLARSHEGSGLGLKITRRIVEQMQGAITVRSRKGEGTTFSVTFPREQAPSLLDESTTRPRSLPRDLPLAVRDANTA